MNVPFGYITGDDFQLLIHHCKNGCSASSNSGVFAAFLQFTQAASPKDVKRDRSKSHTNVKRCLCQY